MPQGLLQARHFVRRVFNKIHQVVPDINPSNLISNDSSFLLYIVDYLYHNDIWGFTKKSTPLSDIYE